MFCNFLIIHLIASTSFHSPWNFIQFHSLQYSTDNNVDNFVKFDCWLEIKSSGDLHWLVTMNLINRFKFSETQERDEYCFANIFYLLWILMCHVLCHVLLRMFYIFICPVVVTEFNSEPDASMQVILSCCSAMGT